MLHIFYDVEEQDVYIRDISINFNNGANLRKFWNFLFSRMLDINIQQNINIHIRILAILLAELGSWILSTLHVTTLLIPCNIFI